MQPRGGSGLRGRSWDGGRGYGNRHDVDTSLTGTRIESLSTRGLSLHGTVQVWQFW